MDEPNSNHGEALPRLLTVDEISTELRVSTRHARGLIKAKRIKSVTIGRCIRIQRSELERLIREGV